MKPREMRVPPLKKHGLSAPLPLNAKRLFEIVVVPELPRIALPLVAPPASLLTKVELLIVSVASEKMPPPTAPTAASHGLLISIQRWPRNRRIPSWPD